MTSFGLLMATFDFLKANFGLLMASFGVFTMALQCATEWHCSVQQNGIAVCNIMAAATIKMGACWLKQGVTDI